MKRPTTDKDVAVYGMIRNSSLFLFIVSKYVQMYTNMYKRV